MQRLLCNLTILTLNVTSMQKNVTCQPVYAWWQVRGLSASRGNLERRPCSSGDPHRAAGCGGRAQRAPMAADIYSVKWLTRHPIFCCADAVLATYQPSLQLNWVALLLGSH